MTRADDRTIFVSRGRYLAGGLVDSALLLFLASGVAQLVGGATGDKDKRRSTSSC